MSYFAVAFAREGNTWSAEELEFDDVEDLDGLVDLATTVTDDAAVAFAAVEEDDEWLALLRFDARGDARVFLSDTRVLATSEIAGLFADAIEAGTTRVGAEDDEESAAEDDEEDTSVVLDAEPGGDAALLSDLGVSAATLLELCAKEGALPGDITAALCEQLGCGEVYDSVRGG